MKNLLLAGLHLILGTAIGLGLFEAVLHANPALLLRGMALPAPVDPPITERSYEVRYSDADAFFWRPDLIQPVPRGEDLLEARVNYRTDEFGFRNRSPLLETVDIVVLGRSISLAAHLSASWPELLAKQTGWEIVNLSQPGSGIDVKADYLRRFGLPRRPRWVVIEVVPSIDIRDHIPPSRLLSQDLFTPLVQGLWHRFSPDARAFSTGHVIYPLKVDLPGRRVPLTCCLHYLEFFTLDEAAILASNDWQIYQQKLLNLVDVARSNDACAALLVAPTKPDIYFPLAVYDSQLEPTLRELTPITIDPDGNMTLLPGGRTDVETIRRNAFAGRDVVLSFARKYNLPVIDPTQVMAQSILDGKDPFMVYDSHWNEQGHQLVAQLAVDILENQPCP